MAAEIEASLLAKVQTAESTHEQPVLIGWLFSRKKRIGTLIEATNGQSLKELKREIKRKGGKKLKIYKEINTIYAEMPVDKVTELASVTCAQKVYDAEGDVRPSLYESVPLVMGVEKWKLPYRVNGKKVEGKGVKIAVIDSGIDKSHPDLRWRVKRRKNFSKGRRTRGTEHGTHVAGIIAGTGKLSGYRWTGVAPKAKLYDAKIFADSETSAPRTAVLDAIKWVIRKKVDIINMSLGAKMCSDGTCSLCQMANHAVSRGITVVVSAGNEGPGGESIRCPGNAKQVITVGATTKTEPAMVAGFSSRGGTLISDKPDVVAPGIAIKAPQPGNRYEEKPGTSMAAPHVSGLAALLYQSRKYLGKKAKPTPAEIKQWLQQGCVDLGEHPSAQGSGLVNFDNTIKSLQQQPKRSWKLRKKKKKKTQPALQTLEASSSTPDIQLASKPHTCPAALNMFCPHYDHAACNEKYESCVHYQTASQQKVLQAVRKI